MLIDSIEEYKGDKVLLENMILNHANFANFIHKRDPLSKKQFQLLFLAGLNRVMLQIMISDEDDVYGKYFTPDNYHGQPLLLQNHMASEEVMIEVLDRYDGYIVSYLECTTAVTKENLLHMLIGKRMMRAVGVLIENYWIDPLYFAVNSQGNIPIAEALSLGDFLQQDSDLEDGTGGNIGILFRLWKEMMEVSMRNQF